MNRKFLKTTALLIASLVAGHSMLLAAEDKPKLPQTLTVTCSVDSYGFTPIQKSWLIGQHGSGLNSHELVLKRYGQVSGKIFIRTPIPAWKGSKTIVVRDDYSVRIDAHYMIRKRNGDFICKPSGLTIDVSYFYKEKLIGFASAGSWSEEKEISVSASATDTAYMALMNENGFGIPSQFAGYSQGFRYWAAVRGGLNGREGGLTFESLSAALKPLERDGNMMMPTVTVHSAVSRPTGSDIPEANFPR
jgi:hypothetical protein